VEVYFGEGVEAYVTPAGPARVGIAFLCEQAARRSYGELLALFPEVEERVVGSACDSALAGAGPLSRAARVRSLDRLLMVGDAAGYVDAITGEGISLALQCALELGKILPEGLAAGATRDAFRLWEQAEARRFALYATFARLVLGLARRPQARRATLGFFSRHPRIFSALVGAFT